MSTSVRTRNRWLGLGIVAALLAAGLFALFVGRYSEPTELHGTLLEPPEPADDFVLQSANGPVRLSDHRGDLVVLFFGFTHCPDYCPLTMQRLSVAMRELGRRAGEVSVILVTVDPERDTPQALADYVERFDPTFTGLTGERQRIEEIAASFGVYQRSREGDGADHGQGQGQGSGDTGYMVDHTTHTFVLDRSGDVRLLWSYGTTPEEMAEDLAVLLEG